MEGFLDDLRVAVRSLCRTPALTVAALLTLTLCLGANIAVFSMINAVLLRPLPYESPHEIVRVWEGRRMTAEDYVFFQENQHSLTTLSAYGSRMKVLLGGDEPERLLMAEITPNLFSCLGARPAIGRTFTEAEGEPGGDKVVILSNGLWNRRFGGDREILGKTVTIENEPYMVVGVMPSDHRPLFQGWEAWVPLVIDPASDLFRKSAGLSLIGRLGAGGATGAQDDVRALARQLHEQNPQRFNEEAVKNASIRPLTESVIGDVGRSLLILWAMTGGVLLIGSVNLTNLLLARALRQWHALAVAQALGAGRFRLIRQRLTEALVLVAAGGALGTGFAAWMIEILRGTLAEVVPRYGEIRLHGEAFGFAAFLSLGVALLVGLLPALYAARSRPWQALGSEATQTHRPARFRFARTLMASQVSLCVVLIIAASLLGRSFQLLRHEPLGFHSDNVLTFKLFLPRAHFDETRSLQFFEQARERFAALPGIESAGASTNLPITGGSLMMPYLEPGQERPESGPPPLVRVNIVTPGFLEALSVSLLRGRPLTEADRAGALDAALINTALAEDLWPGEDPLGKELYNLEGEPWLTIVGEVENVSMEGHANKPYGLLYLPLAQISWPREMIFALRSAATPPNGTMIREITRSIDTRVPVTEISTLRRIVDEALSTERRLAVLTGIFAVLATLLALIGIYGLTAHFTEQRRAELRIRRVLGADDRALVREEIVRALKTVAWGISVGFGASLLLARWIEHFLHKTDPLEPMILAAVVILLPTASALATFLPARRAVRML